MDCPVCQKAMSEQDFGGIKVDVCADGCRGIWFDWFELEKLDETHEGLGEALKNSLEGTREQDESRGQINCPRCQKPMIGHLYKAAKDVTVDECYLCGGFYLDAGELKAIRDSFMNESQREQFVKQILDQTTEYQQAQEDLKKIKARSEALSRMTRVLRVSDYFTK
ncbi:MAG: zf-TFIIB domain-containing protein [Candidatus Omnitrophica bacterium]|nr:zf-TFIIB domain-containing protein [Candidatus Omnitrophota bacterium]